VGERVEIEEGDEVPLGALEIEEGDEVPL